jgi:hypothetical protein
MNAEKSAADDGVIVDNELLGLVFPDPRKLLD